MGFRVAVQVLVVVWHLTNSLTFDRPFVLFSPPLSLYLPFTVFQFHLIIDNYITVLCFVLAYKIVLF